MTKKSRRARKSTERRQTIRPASQPAPRLVSVSAVPESQQASDSSEYHYVILDLKRVAILAMGIFALLVALSFFIH